MNILKIYLSLKYNLLIITVVALFGIGCSSTESLNLDNNSTDATLWMQNAAEYKAITNTIYHMAGMQLSAALNVDSWTADIKQEDETYHNLPPAIILDIDETVLDNSAFQARLIKQHKVYTPEKWNRWVHEEKADAIPGALAFTQKAANEGITVFYLTNRDASVEKATCHNLRKLGFPLKNDVDVILTKHEQPDWTSTKEARRAFVAKKYRILMFFGDNLNDFLPAKNITHAQRITLINKYKKRFGTQWFILPNPVYGSWQQALYDFDQSLSPLQIEKRKKDMLHTKN